VTPHTFCWLQFASALHDSFALSPYSHSSPAIEQGSPSRGRLGGHGEAPASGPPELLPLLLPDELPDEPDDDPLLLPDEPPEVLPPDDPPLLPPEPLPLELVLPELPPLLLPEELPDDDPLPLPDEPPDEPPDDVLPLPLLLLVPPLLLPLVLPPLVLLPLVLPPLVLLPPLLDPLLPEVLPEPLPLEPCPPELLPELPDPDPLPPASAPPSPRSCVNEVPPHAHIAATATTAQSLERMPHLHWFNPVRRSNSDTTGGCRHFARKVRLSRCFARTCASGMRQVRASCGARDREAKGPPPMNYSLLSP
jgi:hypothetical protein